MIRVPMIGRVATSVRLCPVVRDRMSFDVGQTSAAGNHPPRTTARTFAFMRQFTRRARTVLDSAIERLDEHTDTDMSDYMIRGNDVEEAETNPWDESPFTKTYQLAGDPGEKKPELALQNAKKIRDKTLRAGSISSDSAVEPAMDTLNGSHTPANFYYRTVGPVCASAPDVEWTTAFRVDLETAPELHSDEWKAAVSEFRLSQRAKENKIPKKIRKCYGALLKHTKRNDGDRAIHPEELKRWGPVMRDRDRHTAFEHIAKLPGVDGPDESGPAWEVIEEEPADVTDDAQAEGKTHA